MRKQRQLWAVLVAAMAIAVVVAGCGGGGGSTTEGTTATTAGGGEETSGGSAGGGSSSSKAAFIKEADAVCGEGETALPEELSKYVEEKGLKATAEPTEKQTLEIALAVVLPNFSKQAEKISDLTAPEGDEETIESMVGSLENGITELEENPKQLSEGSGSLASFGEEAGDYGLKICAHEGA